MGGVKLNFECEKYVIYSKDYVTIDTQKDTTFNESIEMDDTLSGKEKFILVVLGGVYLALLFCVLLVSL